VSLALCLLLAGTGGLLSPYSDEDPIQDQDLDERKSIRKQPPPEEPKDSSGGILSLPGLIHLGASYYPSIGFDETPISSRSGSGIDAYFSLSTFLSGVVPWHTQVGVVWVEDKGDFSLTLIKLGTGIHTAVGGNINLNISFGTVYLYGDEVDGHKFTMYFEVRIGTRDVFMPGSFMSVGYLNISNINADINNVDLETIEGFMLTIGFGG